MADGGGPPAPGVPWQVQLLRKWSQRPRMDLGETMRNSFSSREGSRNVYASAPPAEPQVKPASEGNRRRWRGSTGEKEAASGAAGSIDGDVYTQWSERRGGEEHCLAKELGKRQVPQSCRCAAASSFLVEQTGTAVCRPKREIDSETTEAVDCSKGRAKTTHPMADSSDRRFERASGVSAPHLRPSAACCTAPPGGGVCLHSGERKGGRKRDNVAKPQRRGEAARSDMEKTWTVRGQSGAEEKREGKQSGEQKQSRASEAEREPVRGVLEDSLCAEDLQLYVHLWSVYVVKPGAEAVGLWLQRPDIFSPALWPANELYVFCRPFARLAVSLPPLRKENPSKNATDAHCMRAVASLTSRRSVGEPDRLPGLLKIEAASAQPAPGCQDTAKLEDLLQNGTPQKQLLALLARLATDPRGFLALIKSQDATPAVAFALQVKRGEKRNRGRGEEEREMGKRRGGKRNRGSACEETCKTRRGIDRDGRRERQNERTNECERSSHTEFWRCSRDCRGFQSLARQAGAALQRPFPSLRAPLLSTCWTLCDSDWPPCLYSTKPSFCVSRGFSSVKGNFSPPQNKEIGTFISHARSL
ncbi:polynucleotide adenylyltransferase [Toxoplasma gondii TgCatPRC2]|uniref:Polynucleotide adenylyltransferase n=1 Tax=Toxoplasma gondii TgCatPRC2 TaxID=1130821 RepID=A0A151H7C6_TOXGO|nr:polynucleotide adenylyltransferase [Toxoplasma gondii TgCatPRC2]